MQIKQEFLPLRVQETSTKGMAILQTDSKKLFGEVNILLKTETAEYIKTACNAHEDLVKALQMIVDHDTMKADAFWAKYPEYRTDIYHAGKTEEDGKVHIAKHYLEALAKAGVKV